MARETKPGIPYFSHDVYMTNDLKIKILIAKHGLIGYGLYNRLLEEVYQGDGYYLQITDDFNILFSNDCNLTLDVYNEILNTCIEKGLFDKEIYHQYSILTSHRIQKNYIAGTKRRDSVEFITEYLLEDPFKSYNLEKVDVNIIDLNACIEDKNADTMLTNNDSIQQNADIGTQSKVNNKVKKKESKKKVKCDPPKIEYIQQFVDSISEATKNLCREKNIGVQRFSQLSSACFDHFRGKGEQKADWEATVRNWIRNDEKFNNKTNSQNSGISIADRMNQESEKTRQNTNEIL